MSIKRYPLETDAGIILMGAGHFRAIKVFGYPRVEVFCADCVEHIQRGAEYGELA